MRRWIVDVPNAAHSSAGEKGYNLGHPTMSGGIVYVGTDQGHLVAIADPSIWPAGASRCTNPGPEIDPVFPDGHETGLTCLTARDRAIAPLAELYVDSLSSATSMIALAYASRESRECLVFLSREAFPN